MNSSLCSRPWCIPFQLWQFGNNCPFRNYFRSKQGFGGQFKTALLNRKSSPCASSLIFPSVSLNIPFFCSPFLSSASSVWLLSAPALPDRLHHQLPSLHHCLFTPAPLGERPNWSSSTSLPFAVHSPLHSPWAHVQTFVHITPLLETVEWLLVTFKGKPTLFPVVYVVWLFLPLPAHLFPFSPWFPLL